MRFSINHFVSLLLAFVLLPAIAMPEESGAWKFLPPTPTARTEVAVVNHQDKIYLIGGFTPAQGDVFIRSRDTAQLYSLRTAASTRFAM